MSQNEGEELARAFLGRSRRPVGVVRMRVERHGKLVYRCSFKNLFLNAGLPALAALLGGGAGSWDAVAVGFGTSGTTPTVADVGLTGGYYKALDSASEDGSGSVTFDWSLTTADMGANGMTIQEIGLFANHASAGLPGSTAPAPILARRVFAPIAFTAPTPAMNIFGTWTLTF